MPNFTDVQKADLLQMSRTLKELSKSTKFVHPALVLDASIKIATRLLTMIIDQLGDGYDIAGDKPAGSNDLKITFKRHVEKDQDDEDSASPDVD